MNEKQIQNNIMREFSTRMEMRLWRQNVGKAVPASFLNIVKSKLLGGDLQEALRLLESPPVISFGVKGQADLSGILKTGHRLEIEVKTDTGKQSKDQEIFQKVIESKNGCYILARSVDDVQTGINSFLFRRA